VTALRALLAVLACLTLMGCGSNAQGTGPAEFPKGSTMARVQQRGVLVVGIKFDQPLFGYKNPGTGRITGFDAEIARLIAKDITGSERNVQFVETISRNREDFLARGVVDIVIATYSITPERSARVGFTDPYYYAGQDILVRTGDTRIHGVDDLNGRTVCTASGSTSQDGLRARAPRARIVLVDAYSECIPALIGGRLDAISTDDTILLGLMSGHPDALQLVGEPFSREPYGIGLRRSDTVFRDYLNGRIRDYLRDGQWDRCFRDTIGVAGVPPGPVKPSLTARPSAN
jgi:ABC-type amino acid transport/signal transduction systems, periplasmic component/domain